jgi:hypothetical protein
MYFIVFVAYTYFVRGEQKNENDTSHNSQNKNISTNKKFIYRTKIQLNMYLFLFGSLARLIFT